MSAQESSSRFDVIMAEPDTISPIARTPQTSNSRPTPPNEQDRNSSEDNSAVAALRRIPFPTVPESDEDEQAFLSAIISDSEMERMFELGYDSDGELAP